MMNKKPNIQWHELKCGDIVKIKLSRGGDTAIIKVLSFRKVMAIVLCDNGQYELFEPGEFNSLYSAKLTLVA